MGEGKKMAAAAFLALVLFFAAPMPAFMTAGGHEGNDIKGRVAQAGIGSAYTVEERVAAAWIDFLTKRLKYPDSLQILDIIAWDGGDFSHLEITYRAKNGYGGMNTKCLAGFLRGANDAECENAPFLVLPDGYSSFPNRRDIASVKRKLSFFNEKRLDAERVKRCLLDLEVRYQYYDGGTGADAPGWREEDEKMNEIEWRGEKFFVIDNLW